MIRAVLDTNVLASGFVAFATPVRAPARLLHLLAAEAELTPITAEITGIATHPEDDLILAVAVSSGADYLVTGDTRLLRLGSFSGVRILSARDFLEVLEQNAIA